MRELEQRIAKAPPAVDVGAEQDATGRRASRRDYQEHIRLMADLLVLAFQADLTRIATFVFANDGSNRSYRTIGVAEGHHDLSHHGGDKEKQEKIQKINHFHIAQFAYLLEQAEGGEGGRRHAARQLHDRLRQRHQRRQPPQPRRPADPAGGQGRRHDQAGPARRYPKETPLTNLYLSMLDRMGVKVDSFGDSTGRLDGLEG